MYVYSNGTVKKLDIDNKIEIDLTLLWKLNGLKRFALFLKCG